MTLSLLRSFSDCSPVAQSQSGYLEEVPRRLLKTQWSQVTYTWNLAQAVCSPFVKPCSGSSGIIKHEEANLSVAVAVNVATSCLTFLRRMPKVRS